MISKIKFSYSDLFFSALLLVFIFYKIPYLQLPLYWDEGWVYGKAIRTMADTQISIYPGNLEYEVGRGHPLLFHVSFATLLKIFGNTLVNTHIIALSISLFLIILIYFIGKNEINNKKEWILIGIVLSQSIFLAQSGLILPEITLTIFILTSLYAYSKNKKIILFFVSAAAILIKESSVILFVSLSVFSIVQSYATKDNLYEIVKKLIRINSPLLFWLFHLMAHKLSFGSFLFHEHTEFIKLDPSLILGKLERMFFFIFLAQGRNVIFFSALALILYNLIKRETLIFKNSLLILISIFILLFMIFSSVNYYTERYMTVNIILFILGFYILVMNSTLNMYLKVSMLLLSAISSLYSSCFTVANSDVHPGYANVIKNHQQTINYILAEIKKDDTIYVWFNMKEQLQNHYVGFVQKDYQFKNLRSHPDKNCNYFIFTSIENPDEKNILEKEYNLVSHKKFKHKQSWTEIMRKP